MAIAALLAAAGLLVWAVVIYNRFVRDRNRVAAAWSDVDVQLKRRHDLIPNLVEVVKRQAGYERGVLERVVALRAQAQAAPTLAQKGSQEATLSRDLQRLIAVAESYPVLKASESFLDLQRSLSEAEDFIQHARRYYNGAVNNFNTRLDTFPDLVIGRLLGLDPAEYFELDDAGEAQPVQVS
jgi:LemA protein